MMFISLILFLLIPMVTARVIIYDTLNTDLQAHTCFYYSNAIAGLNSVPYCLQQESNFVEFSNNSCLANSLRYTFENLKHLGYQVADLLQWSIPVDTVEQYEKYLQTNDSRLAENFICNCSNSSTFGQFCELKLYFGETIEESMREQFKHRRATMIGSQLHERRSCYRTMRPCDSGLMCLDWRQICDGEQNCMDGVDEEYCETLEFNECEPDEYRCGNGMCIPAEYFLDGDTDKNTE